MNCPSLPYLKALTDGMMHSAHKVAPSAAACFAEGLSAHAALWEASGLGQLHRLGLAGQWMAEPALQLQTASVDAVAEATVRLKTLVADFIGRLQLRLA